MSRLACVTGKEEGNGLRKFISKDSGREFSIRIQRLPKTWVRLKNPGLAKEDISRIGKVRQTILGGMISRNEGEPRAPPNSVEVKHETDFRTQRGSAQEGPVFNVLIL